MTVPTTVGEYLAATPEWARAMIDEIRALALAEAPGAAERISYQMPAMTFEGRIVVWYGAFRDHVSLFPASDRVRRDLAADLDPYLAGKGTVRFARTRPLPTALIRRFVRARIEENRAAALARTSATRSRGTPSSRDES
ncbi:MAG TPA: DUF1801 domain-containing protein [Candidatus Limnocylindrales bacterium]|nr:DUF1801 domain-containing protein [Candidatus Limnocylindrales bacterium]